jgi:hypothetical protein
MNTENHPDQPPAVPVIGEVRYSLKSMLEELKVERTAGTFAMEKFSQTEIEKIFKARAPRHAKRQK